MLQPGERESGVNWPLWLGAGLLSCAILGAAGGFHYWRRARLEVRAVAPEVPHVGVRRCIVRVFESLRFPPPEGGIVTVVYPIVLQPG